MENTARAMTVNGITVQIDGTDVKITDEDGPTRLDCPSVAVARRMARLAVRAAGVAGLDAIDVRTRAVAAADTEYASAGIRATS